LRHAARYLETDRPSETAKYTFLSHSAKLLFTKHYRGEDRKTRAFLRFWIYDARIAPVWLDTVEVPVEGHVDLMMDSTDPIIRGGSRSSTVVC
jgi:hypothetical protein